jgi:hypothetical protein
MSTTAIVAIIVLILAAMMGLVYFLLWIFGRKQ